MRKPDTETPYLKIWKESEILHCVFAEKLDITLEIARSCVETRLKFSNGVSYPCLIDMKHIRSANKEAREYLATEGAKLVKAGALLIGSSLTRMIGNIFLSLNKPKVPSRLFTDENEARLWLKKFTL